MKKMTLGQHFVELRRRILWVACVFVLALCAGWVVSPFLQAFLTKPLLDVWTEGALLYGGVTDGLMIRFSLSVLFSLFVTTPFAFWQVWAFVAPGLHKKEKDFVWPILICSPLLFLIGAAFAFYILFPFVFSFFIELNQSAPVPSVVLPMAKDYLSFTIGMLKIFGLAFQLPLILVLLNRVGVLSKSYAIKMRRYAIVFIVIIAAVLTPPDVVSQVLLALPMWLLFELSLLFMKSDDNV